MTEIGHGSNVPGLETTATFDEASDQFIIHTPTLTATKVKKTYKIINKPSLTANRYSGGLVVLHILQHTLLYLLNWSSRARDTVLNVSLFLWEIPRLTIHCPVLILAISVKRWEEMVLIMVGFNLPALEFLVDICFKSIQRFLEQVMLRNPNFNNW